MENKQLIPPKEEDYFDKWTLVGCLIFLLIIFSTVYKYNIDLIKSINKKKIYANATIFEIYRSKSGTKARYYYSYNGKTLNNETTARTSYYRGANYFVVFNPDYPKEPVFIPIKITDNLYSPQEGWSRPPMNIKEDEIKKYVTIE